MRLTETFQARFAADAAHEITIRDFIADPEQRMLLIHVLEGRLLHADLAVPSAAGTVAVEADAVLHAGIIRHALLTLSPAGQEPDLRPGTDPLLNDPSLDDSSAMVWIKDVGGRYLRVNRSYSEWLGIDDADIRGKTDAELSPAHVVDDRRLRGHEGDDAKPVQLEYTVEAFGGRDALTVLRFPVRDLNGSPIAVCRVAAPAAEAGTARSEGERLLRIERWARLSDAAIRAELLEEWQLVEIASLERRAVPDSSAEPAPTTAANEAELARLRDELERERGANAELEARLEEAHAAKTQRGAQLGEDQAPRAELEVRLTDERAVDSDGSLRAALEQRLAEALRRAVDAEEKTAAEQAAGAELLARAEQAEAAVDEVRASGARSSAAAERANAAAELSRARAGGLESALANARQVETDTRAALAKALSEVADLQEVLANTQVELSREPPAAPAVPELPARPPSVPLAVAGASPSPSGLAWSHRAQRALTVSLAGASEWRTGLKDAIRILGSEGGWDVAVAWCSEERAVTLRCMAMWSALPDQLGVFQTATWQGRQSPTATAVGQAGTSDHASWLGNLGALEDAHLAEAAAVGMQSALLVPIRHGAEASGGVLELLTRTAATPDPELGAAAEAVALQLAHFEYLLRRGAEPRWRLGRM